MKKLLLFGVALVISVASALTLGGSPASGVSDSRLMDDHIFNNSRTMNADKIDAFLNRFPKSCISLQNGFSAIEPIGYNKDTGYQYGELVSAGKVIANAAHAYGINPQVLIAMLQKEQSLVTGNAGCDAKRIASAVGYSCPDNVTLHNYSGVRLYAIDNNEVTSIDSTCVNQASRAGFSQQVIRAAWLLKFSQQRALGNTEWAAVHGNWDNSDDLQKCYRGPKVEGHRKTCPKDLATYHNGERVIDGHTIKIATGATAALYHYTPHFAGNQLFVKTFQSWFGPTITPHYSWQITNLQAYTDQTKTTSRSIHTMKPGERAFVVIDVKNTSNYTWSNTGMYPIKLGTLHNRDRDSAFYTTGWLSGSRPALMSQRSVAPGETATFAFWYQAPNAPGVYKEHFGLVSEAKAWLPDKGLAIETVVTPQ